MKFQIDGRMDTRDNMVALHERIREALRKRQMSLRETGLKTTGVRDSAIIAGKLQELREIAQMIDEVWPDCW